VKSFNADLGEDLWQAPKTKDESKENTSSPGKKKELATAQEYTRKLEMTDSELLLEMKRKGHDIIMEGLNSPQYRPDNDPFAEDDYETN
jgi:hypothetical protein